MSDDENGQSDLFDLLRVYTEPQRFVRFHNANLHVFHVLEDACARFVGMYGVQQTSIYYLVHFARFERIIGTRMTGIDGDYKISNMFSPYYARLILDRHPEWAGLFVTRKAVADDLSQWLGECRVTPTRIPSPRKAD